MQATVRPRHSPFTPNRSLNQYVNANTAAQGKFSAFPLPRAASLATGDKKGRDAASIPRGFDVDVMHGTSNDHDPVGLDSWRSNMHVFRPQDYWKGSVDYEPWELGDNNDDDDDECNPKTLQKGTELEPGSGVTGRRKDQDAIYIASAAPSSNVALARVDAMEGGGGVEEGSVSGEVEVEPGVEANRSGAVVMGVGEVAGEGEGGIGMNGVKCERSSDGRTSLKPNLGLGEVGTALHSVLDALRNVREERLRSRCLATSFTREPEVDG